MSIPHVAHPALDARIPPEWSAAMIALDGKRPVSRDWPNAPAVSGGDVLGWIEEGRNVGLRTGRLSGVVVVDVDMRKGGVIPDDCPEETIAVETGGGGLHLYYKFEGTLGNSAGKLGPHVDVKAEHGQVVFPGSIHPDTSELYRWAEGHAPWEIPLAPLPESVVARLAKRNGDLPRDREDGGDLIIPEGKRNDSLARLAGVMRRRSMTPEAIEAALLEENRLRCAPPLTEEEVRAIAASVGRYQPAPEPEEAPHPADDGERPPLVSLTVEELLEVQRPPRELLLDPIFRTRDTAMIAAERGVGKSWVSVGMASAIAAGGRFLEWTAPKPRHVLYVDGELPVETLQDRFRLIRSIYGHTWGGRLRLLPADLQEGSIPSLNTIEAQMLVEKHLGEAEVLVLDNLSCLCRGGVENEAESWEMMQVWLLSLRRRGIAVLFDHHAGRSGKPRGTSKREDTLDLVIELKRPDDYQPDQGARFEVHYTKARNHHGAAVAAFEAHLYTGGSLTPPTWTTRPLAAVIRERVLNLHAEGLAQKDIAHEVGRSKSVVSRIISASKKAGGEA